MSDYGKSALIVDHARAAWSGAVEMLRGEGCAAEFVSERAAAVAWLRARDFDVVFLDLGDSDLGGGALLAEIKNDPALAAVPVIGVLAEEQAHEIDVYMDAGISDFLMRPIDPFRAKARLRAALRERTLRQSESQRTQSFQALNEIGVALSAEKDLDRLLERILIYAKDIANADGGSLYLRTEDDCLKFEIMRTDSLNFALGGTTRREIPFPPLPMYNPETNEPNHRNIATHVALSGKSVNIADAYEADGFDFSGTRAFDIKTGYRSRSFLTIPMKNVHGDVIGVVQLLNASETKGGPVTTFSAENQAVIESLASQAAVAVDNQMLLESQKELLDSFIKLIAAAIDAKSPYTGGHCARVPLLTEMLADAACDATSGPFTDFDLNQEQRYELHTAAWLHDCGKVTTPEHVVDKGTKLETIYDRIHAVATRFEVLKRDAEIVYLKALREADTDAEDAGAEFEKKCARYDDDRAFLERANIGGEFMSDERIQRIAEIAKHEWVGADGESQNLLTENELYNLSIRKGTLTQEERLIINNHIVMTIEMLEKLPFPEHLRNVPEFAGGHHERMDGRGYPRGLRGDQMSVPARMMAIADVFEALTACDRPYKKAMKLSQAMDILGKMKLDHHIDPNLFDLFVEHEVHLKYAGQFLFPEQIDTVDVAKYLGPLPDAEPGAAKKTA